LRKEGLSLSTRSCLRALSLWFHGSVRNGWIASQVLSDKWTNERESGTRSQRRTADITTGCFWL